MVSKKAQAGVVAGTVLAAVARAIALHWRRHKRPNTNAAPAILHSTDISEKAVADCSAPSSNQSSVYTIVVSCTEDQTAEGRGPQTAARQDDTAHPHDQQIQGLPACQDIAELKLRLTALQEIQQENARLQAFLCEHMAVSAKVALLEEENRALKATMEITKAQLVEVQEARDKQVASALAGVAADPTFGLSTGAELQDFKGMLATRLPLEARSMCSDLDGTAAGAVSVDTTVTVAGTGRRARGSQASFWKELAMLLGTAPAPTWSGARSVKERQSSADTPKVAARAAATPSQATSPEQGPGTSAVKVPVDVSHLLDSWTSRGRVTA